MSINDLWGEIPIENEIKLPVTILKEQATILGEKTNKILDAKVSTLSFGNKDIVGYALNIFAPALSNFKYRVLHITHSPVFVYPVFIYHEQSDEGSVEARCDNEVEFINQLAAVLSSNKVHTAISSLIAQSKATG